MKRTRFYHTGNRPRIGQAFLVIDPAALAGVDVYHERIETLLAAMLQDDGVRLPGARRHQLATTAQERGLDIPEATLAPLEALAQA